MGIQHRDKRLLIMNEYKSASMPVSGLHGGRSALGVDTRWAACACSLQMGLLGQWGADRHAGVCKGERSLNGRRGAAVKELGMALGGAAEEDRR
jgi:hypothetical protein